MTNRTVTVRRRWSALVCLGLTSAVASRSLAEDLAPQPAAGLQGGASFFDGAAYFAPDEEDAVAPAAREADRPPAQAGKPVSLLEAVVRAIADDPSGRKHRAAVEKQRKAAEEQRILQGEADSREEFEQMLYVELSFLRRTCKPDPKLFVEIAKAAKAGVHVPLRQYVRAQQAQEQGGAPADPRLVVQKLLAPLAEAKLGREKARLYRRECDTRAAACKHAAMLNLVADADQRLVLTAAQRATLAGLLSAFGVCDSIPDAAIMPLLNAKQKLVWQASSQQRGGQYENDEWAVDFGPDAGEATEIQEIARLVQEVKDGR